MTALAVAIVVAAVLISIALFLRKPAGGDVVVRDLQAEVHLMREMTESSIHNINSAFTAQLQGVTANVQSSLASVTSELGNRLEGINRQVTEQLNQSTNVMNANTSTVSKNIAAVQTTFASLQKQVGEMTEHSRQLTEVSKVVASLDNVLRSPKMRGNFGEEQLGNLLGMVFSQQQYAMPHRFSSGEMVDAVVFLPQGAVAIDSKFPLENFRRITEMASESDKKSARRDFLRDVKKRVDEIATKYIRPAEGTLPFALMYVPAENVYYETIIRDDEDFQLYSYCQQKRVMPVSPNSLYAYLQTIMVGLKGLQVSQRAETILREIESLKIELDKFTKAFETVGQHIRNASAKMDEGTKLLTKVEVRVESLGGSGAEQPLLFEEKKKSLGTGS
ncbi:MAG TPA: DNA recombination protein RmuC [Alphaproteobacteria bacterium]|nr:DNA recombination protein RmuC [Alphaproteobacteria bacterium]